MKPSYLKRIFSILALLGAFSMSHPLKAQFVVYDPAQFTNMLRSLANDLQVISNTSKTLRETRNILSTAKKTKEEIENIYHLQWEVQEALEIARDVSRLKWSNLDEVTGKALGLSVDPDVYLPRLPETAPLRQALRQEAGASSTRKLYSLLVGINQGSAPLADYAAFEEASRQVIINRFAMAEMTDQKKIQTALSYNQLADEMIEQAKELMQAVKRDRQLTMNDAERLSMLKQCQDMLVKSLEMKLEADELLRTVSEQSSASRDALLQSYRNQLVRKALAESPQMKYGQ
jgi:hypothetical protein